jgi:signal transduction histidine kinase
VAAHAVRLTNDLQRLTVDLQRSRERLVTAREEERRRLRRDLHDGLGPTLGALMLQVGSARALLTHDPAAEGLLNALEVTLEGVMADIRRLVYNLRPPALDELGLIAG